MQTVNIGGVPEHFNYPWYLTLKDKKYQQKGINLRWKDYYGGTGAMNESLRNGEIDLAVILSEGIIKDIVDGNRSKIVQVFVQSPLIWGIHVAHGSKFQTIEDLKGSRAAISRYGSGSHLMAYINAKRHNWDLEKDLNFEIIRNLDGAVKGLSEGKADYFMWEKFTTKPLVDSNIFKRLGTCPTPWPCFVIAVSESFLNNHRPLVKSILQTINEQTINFKEINSIENVIAERYSQKLDDVTEWLALTEWSQQNLSETEVENIQYSLLDLNIIDKKLAYKDIVEII